MTTTLDVFISSKMVELKAERDALYALLPTLDYGDIKLRAWVFEEDAPASNDAIRKIYLKALQNSALYLGLFWNLYGEWTIDEFDRATEWGMERHIYVKDVDANKRDPKLTDFLNKHGDVLTGITAKWFTTDELCEAVKNTLDAWVAEYRSGPLGESTARLYKSPAAIIERPETLIGRDDVLAQIKTFLSQNERILIQGFSGTGKTALAGEVAAQFITDNPGHVLWLRIGRNDEASIFEALASVFDARTEMAKQAGDGKAHLLRSLLAESQIRLVVLDDAWNGQALPPVTKAIPPTMPLIVTSRRHYGLSQPVSIGDLAPDAGLQLLSYYAKSDYSKDVQARELCSALSNLPFAVRIAGINLKMRSQQPIILLNQIRQMPHIITPPLGFSEKGRENVGKLLEVSLNALDKKSRDLFMAFGAFFAPHLTFSMLQIYKGKFIPINKSLEKLQDHGLIAFIAEANDCVAYYRIHDLAYSYAKALIGLPQHRKAVLACVEYLKNYLISTQENFRAIYAEIANFLAAATWALEDGMYQEVEVIALILYSDEGNKFLLYKGMYEQAIVLLQQAATAAEFQGDIDNYTIHMGNLGLTYTDIGQYDVAITCFEKILPIHTNKGDLRNISMDMAHLAIIHTHKENYLMAGEYCIRALSISKQLGDARLIAHELGIMGNIYAVMDRPQLAIDVYKDIIPISRSIGDERLEGNALGSLGMAYVKLGQYEEAIQLLEQALKINAKLGHKQDQTNILGNLAHAYSARSQYDQALQYYEQTLEISREIGDRRSEAQDLNNLGSYHEKRGNYPVALKFYEQSKTVWITLGIGGEINRLNQIIEEVKAKL